MTILLMALGTTLIGIAPTYDQVGIFAPLIIVVARLLQGFSAGGEMGGATAFLTEYAPERERAYYSSWIQASIGVAVLLGAAVGTFVTRSLSPEALSSWGWRLPFLLGIVIGPVGYYIRHHLDETPTFRETDERADSPLKEVFQAYPRETFASFSMVILWTVCTYVLLFYMPTYAVKVLNVPQSDGFVAGMVGGCTIMLFAPLVGRLADRIGRRVLLSGSALLILVLAWPMFAYINHVPGLSSLLVFQLVFGILIAAYTGPILARVLRVDPGARAVDRPVGCLQLRGDDLRRLRVVHHHLADCHHRQQHGACHLRNDRGRHQPGRHTLCPRTRLPATTLI